MDRQKEWKKSQMGETEREEYRVEPSLGSRKVRTSKISRFGNKKKYTAPARAGECCLNQRQKKAGWEQMRM